MHTIPPSTKSLISKSRAFLLVAAWIIGAATAVAQQERSPFTVVLLPDTQKYTQMPPANNPYFIQTRWIKDNAEAKNIKFVIHLGDIVQSRNSVRSEWKIAGDAHAILEQGPNPVPYSMVPGNHDLSGSDAPDYVRDTSLYNEFFGPKRFASRAWYGGHQDKTNDNNYCLFKAAGMDFMVLSLELLPSDATLAWADGVIKAHPKHRVIIATHRYLQPSGKRSPDRVYGGAKGNNGTDIFNKLVKNNPTVFMTVSGHLCYEALNVAENASGGKVFEILSDYQSLPFGGRGWLRTLKFDPSRNKITVGSYSPVLDKHNYGKGAYQLDYNMEVPKVQQAAVDSSK
ncbi:MAG: metallophosphoesterase [Planctomycetota bacterium]|nr:metallophosphoesterase [Planctomycetota bacterium]